MLLVFDILVEAMDLIVGLFLDNIDAYILDAIRYAAELLAETSVLAFDALVQNWLDGLLDDSTPTKEDTVPLMQSIMGDLNNEGTVTGENVVAEMDDFCSACVTGLETVGQKNQLINSINNFPTLSIDPTAVPDDLVSDLAYYVADINGTQIDAPETFDGTTPLELDEVRNLKNPRARS